MMPAFLRMQRLAVTGRAIAVVSLLFAASSAWCADVVQAAELQTVRVLAGNCANCHGTDGRSQAGMPRLAGEPKEELLEQLRAFKAGKRPATLMHQLTKGYTDEELAQLADYFSRQRLR